MAKIHFETKLLKIGSWTILLLPKDVSAKLPSRGMVMVEGTINGFLFKTTLEPDGRGSHWLRVTRGKAGDAVKVEIEPIDEWVEPEIPQDFKKALLGSPKAFDLWKNITPNAHWDWVRWIRATRQIETRKRRIEVAISKLKAGTRRPCCFSRNLCNEPHVSHNWVLLGPV